MNTLTTTQTVTNEWDTLNDSQQVTFQTLDKHVQSAVKSDATKVKALVGISEYIANTLTGVPLEQGVKDLQRDFNIILFSHWNQKADIEKLLRNRLANFTTKGTKLAESYHKQADSCKLGFKLENRGQTKEKTLKQAHYAHQARQHGFYTPNDVKKGYSPYVITMTEPKPETEPQPEPETEPQPEPQFNGIDHLINAFEVVLKKHQNGSGVLIGSELDRVTEALRVLQG